MDISPTSDTSVIDKNVSSEERPRPPLLPPCRVCGGKASGFHYGVNSCEACKGFFRRSFCRSTEYKCAGNNECLIQPRRRNNCPACRLRKCQEIGMSKTAIKTGRYSYEKKTQYIEEVKSKETQTFIQSDEVHVYKDTEDNNDGKFSVSKFDNNLDINGDSWPSRKVNVRPRHSDDSKQSQYERYVINPCDSSIKMAENDLKQDNLCTYSSDGDEYKNFRKNVSDEENEKIINDLLKSQDQLIEDLDAFLDEIHMKNRQKEFHQRIQRERPKTLEKNSGPKSEQEIIRDEQMHKVAELMDSEFRNTISFIKAIPGWKSLDMEDQINLIKEGAAELWILGHCQCIDTELGVFTGEYDMTYQDAANIWTDVYVESVYKTSVKFSKLKLTKEELVVLKTIVLTFPDRCQMVDRESVEKVQWRMLKCLQYVCKKNDTPFNRRFAAIMDGLTFARDMTEKFKEIVKTVVCQWVIFEKFPLLQEFFSSF